LWLLCRWSWTVTPFGCKNASKTAHTLIDKLLTGLLNAAAAFQDDIICFSSSFKQHLVDLTNVFTRLREAMLTANGNKCEFLVEKLSLLGHVIQDGQIRPSEDKLASMANLSSESLTTKKQICSALGLINFFPCINSKLRRVSPTSYFVVKKMNRKRSSGMLHARMHCIN